MSEKDFCYRITKFYDLFERIFNKNNCLEDYYSYIPRAKQLEGICSSCSLDTIYIHRKEEDTKERYDNFCNLIRTNYNEIVNDLTKNNGKVGYLLVEDISVIDFFLSGKDFKN